LWSFPRKDKKLSPENDYLCMKTEHSRNGGITSCITGGIYPDRAAKQQPPVMQLIIPVS
jgi:hypothetical protein